jgi:hypothetical protein
LISRITFDEEYRWWSSSWSSYLLFPVILFHLGQKILLLPLTSDKHLLCISSSVSSSVFSSVSDEISYSYKTKRKIEFYVHYTREYPNFFYPTSTLFDVAIQHTILIKWNKVYLVKPNYYVFYWFWPKQKIYNSCVWLSILYFILILYLPQRDVLY